MADHAEAPPASLGLSEEGPEGAAQAAPILGALPHQPARVSPRGVASLPGVPRRRPSQRSASAWATTARSGANLGGGADGQSTPLWSRLQRRVRSVMSLLHLGSSAEVDRLRMSSEELEEAPQVEKVPSKRRHVSLRRVSFSSQNSTHEVTPYARKYGVHPDFFFFGRHGDRRLSDEGIMEEMRRKDEGLAPLQLDGDFTP